MSIPGSAAPFLLAQQPVEEGYFIERSLRFNSSDSAYLSRTPSSAGNRKTWTWAGWVKRCSLATRPALFSNIDASNNNGFVLNFLATGELQAYEFGGSTPFNVYTTSVYRDSSAWYHVVFVLDTTDAVAFSRTRMYVNGVQSTLTTAVSPSLNYDGFCNNTQLHAIGRQGSYPANYLDGYLADIHFCDGYAYDPSYFTEFDDNGILQPKAFTGSYGTNGFHLDFADNSTAAALGTDTSGNGNTWTVNNISVAAGSGNDSLVDVPTNGTETDTGLGGEVRGNYCTFNPLGPGNAGTASWILSNGNLNANDPANCYGVVPGTIGASSGKYYWEISFSGGTVGSTDYWGIERIDQLLTNRYPGNYSNAYWLRGDGNKVDGTGSAVSYGSSFTTSNVAGVAFDADNGTLTFYKDGVSLGTAFTGIATSLAWRPVIGNAANATSITNWILNAGQRPFSFTAPSGFKALCTANLPEPTIKKGSDYFDVSLYTGNLSTQTISGLAFSPDLVWIKSRSNSRNHGWWDTQRGIYKYLISNLTDGEASLTNSLTAFNSDGFDLGDGVTWNELSQTYVAWAWDAGSSTVSNTDGSITSSVRANPSAGFSIVTYTGTGSAATVGHGLNVAPSMVIVKRRSSTGDWPVWHTSLTSLSVNHAIILNLTDAAASYAGYFNGTSPTSSVFSIGTNAAVNASTATYVSYCFAPVEGYSAFGSYTGNGSATDGPFVFTNMRPRWILIKRTDTTGNWWIFDAARDPYNVARYYLLADNSGAEVDNTTAIDLLSNGFKLRTTSAGLNDSAGTYIYAAFAEAAFSIARAR